MPNTRILYSLAFIYSPIFCMNIIGTDGGKQNDPFMLSIYAVMWIVAMILFYKDKQKDNIKHFAYVDILFFFISGLITIFVPIGLSNIIVIIIFLHLYLYWKNVKDDTVYD